MALTATEITDLIQQYAAGPEGLRAALATVPPEAMQWRPAPDEWSVHEREVPRFAAWYSS